MTTREYWLRLAALRAERQFYRSSAEQDAQWLMGIRALLAAEVNDDELQEAAGPH